MNNTDRLKKDECTLMGVAVVLNFIMAIKARKKMNQSTKDRESKIT